MSFWFTSNAVSRRPISRCTRPLVESVESRTFCSASPAPFASSAPVLPMTSVAVRRTIASKPSITQTATASLSINISAGQVTLPNGRVVQVNAKSLSLAAPTVVHRDQSTTAPSNFTPTGTPAPWYTAGVGVRQLVTADTHGVIGGLYHTVVPSSVVVKNAAGKVMSAGVDFEFNADWGQVANVSSRLGTPGVTPIKLSFDVVLQRMDLIEVLSDGSLKVKRGTAVSSNPVLPPVDAGAVGLAGIYVNTLDGAVKSGFQIKQRDIYPITPIAKSAPINSASLAKTRAKLKSHSPVNIAWLGDSVTWGAEAGQYWLNRDQAYTTKVVNGLKSRFGTTAIKETAAYQPGITTEEASVLFQNNVLAPNAAGKKVDLLVIALGLNNVGDGSVESMKSAMTGYVRQAKSAGMDVLLVTPLNSASYGSKNPAGVSARDIAQAIRDVALAENVACADVNTDWINEASRGVAPLSLLHNTFNHPGTAGMQLYANTILRLF